MTGGTGGLEEAKPVEFVYESSDYDGEFKAGADGAYVPHGVGKMEGQGIREPCKGRVYTGTFEDGHPIDGTIIRTAVARNGRGRSTHLSRTARGLSSSRSKV